MSAFCSLFIVPCDAPFIFHSHIEQISVVPIFIGKLAEGSHTFTSSYSILQHIIVVTLSLSKGYSSFVLLFIKASTSSA